MGGNVAPEAASASTCSLFSPPILGESAAANERIGTRTTVAVTPESSPASFIVAISNETPFRNPVPP
jgi:hypothetical protein